MLQEIEVEGLGIMRHCNDWQVCRIMQITNKVNRELAWPAFGLGMTVQQFKKLSPEQQRAAFEAHVRLTAPPPIRSKDAQHLRLPGAWQRVPLEKQIAIGNELIAIKAKLPHGHFIPWVENKSGISPSQARRFIRAAKEAGRQ